jgi:DNA polymerase III subunit delta'
LAKEADKLIDNARDPDLLALLTLGEKLYRTQDGLELFGEFLSASLADRIRAKAHAGAPGLERWVAALNRLEQGFARAAGLNLEPRQTVLSAARDLSHVARSGAL